MHFKPISCYRILTVLAVGLILAGCNESAYEMAPVSGKITLNGDPLAGARVTFQPTGGKENPGPGSIGDTDAQGIYVLKTIHGEPGAVVGKHRVAIISNAYREAAPSDQDVQPVKERIPKRYNLLSELSIDVPAAGLDTANFDLTTP